MEIKTPWLCAGCAKPVQTYFGDEMKLPCAYCDQRRHVSLTIPPGVGGKDLRSGMGAYLSVVFDRVPDATSDRVTWRPAPCVDPTVNTELAAALRAEGLDGCFVKPRHLHGHFVLREGETMGEPCSTGCTWERAKTDGFFAADRSLPGCYTVTTPVPAGRVAVVPYFEMKPEFFAAPLNEAVKKYQEYMLTFTPGPQAGTFTGPGLASALAMQAHEVAMGRSPTGSDGPLDRSIWDFAPDPKTQSTPSDVRGRVSRVDGIEQLECRLGCTCDQHKPPREPWVPSVDELHWLPDA